MKPGDLVLCKSAWRNGEIVIYLSTFETPVGYLEANILRIKKPIKLTQVYRYELFISFIL
jgi:hypothetical protein